MRSPRRRNSPLPKNMHLCQSPQHSFAPVCSCFLVSHIRREPEAETQDAAEASEAAAPAPASLSQGTHHPMLNFWSARNRNAERFGLGGGGSSVSSGGNGSGTKNDGGSTSGNSSGCSRARSMRWRLRRRRWGRERRRPGRLRGPKEHTGLRRKQLQRRRQECGRQDQATGVLDATNSPSRPFRRGLRAWRCAPWWPSTWVSKTLLWSTTRGLYSGIGTRPEDTCIER